MHADTVNEIIELSKEISEKMKRKKELYRELFADITKFEKVKPAIAREFFNEFIRSGLGEIFDRKAVVLDKDVVLSHNLIIINVKETIETNGDIVTPGIYVLDVDSSALTIHPDNNNVVLYRVSEK